MPQLTRGLIINYVVKIFLGLLAARAVQKLLKASLTSRRPVRLKDAPHDRRRETGSQRPHRSNRSEARPSEPSTMQVEPAEESELGAAWHFGGRRRWQWLHDGRNANGWIEFGRAGVLRTSFDRADKPPGQWKAKAKADELTATFGRCHHTLRLVPGRHPDAVPEFLVTERTLVSGKACDRRQPKTMGRLDMKIKLA